MLHRFCNSGYVHLLWVSALLSGLFLWNHLQLELFFISFLLLSFWSILIFSHQIESKGLAIPKSAFLVCLALFWLLMGVSVLQSDILFVSFIGFCIASVLPLTFFTFILRDTEQGMNLVIRALAVIFTGLALWALAQYYIFPDVFGGKATHPLANPNSLAAFFNLAMFPALGVAFSSSNKTLSRFALGFALLMFAGITASLSRGAMLGSLLALIIFIVFAFGAVKKRWPYFMAFLLGIVCLLGFSTLNNQSTVERVESMINLSDDLDVMSSQRLSVWQGAISIIQENWLTGTGIGTFFLYYPSHRIDSDVGGVFQAHNDPLQFWAELGILGPILFYIMGGLIVWQTIRAVSLLDKTDSSRNQIFAVISGLFAIVVHTHFTFNFYIICILFVFGFSLAWWFRKTQDILKYDCIRIDFWNRFQGTYRSAFVVLPLTLLALLFASFMTSEHYAQKAKNHLYDIDLETFSRYIALSDQFAFSLNFRPYSYAVTVPISYVEGSKRTASDEDLKPVFGQAWSYLNKAESLNPQDASIPYYRAYLLQQAPLGLHPDSAEQMDIEALYLKALAINPLHLGARLALLKMYREQNDQKKFEAILEGGLHWKYHTPQAMQYYREVERYFVLSGQSERLKAIKGMQKGLTVRLERIESKLHTPLYNRMFGE